MNRCRYALYLQWYLGSLLHSSTPGNPIGCPPLGLSLSRTDKAQFSDLHTPVNLLRSAGFLFTPNSLSSRRPSSQWVRDATIMHSVVRAPRGVPDLAQGKAS
ncbi:hypothetical protein BD310DRAFT_435194 [Dichomitus squalens]|uniref:Uncharacterized protein n=1 Tax=Dichomitus squalens TaxID=114155 RepID=A0A4Q9PXA1_9APHY|nr:hypothetical protein BD310DRAFT_435194 [Dichomitus squalens]